ncbi:VOC family protein [Streptomyces sp. enrichment culture]|uniref:VOC family protein n=1 Tax=Streptomyces sp. enrichment culture TaxID=1795815 RepID=UPI003F543740
MARGALGEWRPAAHDDRHGARCLPVLRPAGPALDDTKAALCFPADVPGFEQEAAVPDEHGGIGHAELRRPGGGAPVSGSTRHTDSVHGRTRAGTGAVHVVSDDVDAVRRRVADAGGDVLEAPHETRSGPGAAAYVCTVQDPEGDLWTFGTCCGP